MNYPAWDVPFLGGGWVIGIIAIIHVLISHFAVGGGFYLPMAEAKALREGRKDWLEVIHKHAKFFFVLTAVYGAVTGVAIWFAIGLVSPEATSTLIHNFVFGWAIEWVFFIIEITAAAVYYYTWGRVSGRTHLAVGWIYAISAWLSLVIINGILTFMLTPGARWLSVAGTGKEASAFWFAFFNPTYLPSLVLRTLVCIALAGVWALITASRIDGEAKPQLKAEVLRWSARWLIPAYVIMPFAIAVYLWMVPGAQRALLQLGVSTIAPGIFTQVTRMVLISLVSSATISIIVYFLAWRNPLDFRLGHAILVIFLALAATGATEQVREMLRKPYVIVQHMYSNGLRKSEVEKTNREGYLIRSPWAREEERKVWEAMDLKDAKDIKDLKDAAQAKGAAQASGAAGEAIKDPSQFAYAVQKRAELARGELIMRGQCYACHTMDGYRSLRKLFGARDAQATANILKMLHEQPKDSPYRSFMPPLAGTPREIQALSDYIQYCVHGPGAKAQAALAAPAAPAAPAAAK